MKSTRKTFSLLVLAGIFVNVCAVNSTILEPDGALYASIAKTMYLRNDWINLFAHGTDWLDKPHFPFWMTAISYSLFGVTSFAYKFPAILFWGIGACYTWKYAKEWHSRTVAQIALLIYFSALHLVISNNDVRAEPFLTAMLIACVYHYLRASKDHRAHVIYGSAWLAAAVMTKGIFIVIPVALGFLIFWWSGDSWNGIKQQLLRKRWWMAILLVGLFILPELFCLWMQFDLHPEKIVFGRKGVSGLSFFFWDSQFGRFLNSGPIKGKGNPTFFFHTLLWAFLPWAVILYSALGQWMIRVRKPDMLCLGVSLTTFLLFSASQFQLPHYLNIVFPFFAIIAAQWLEKVNSDQRIWSFVKWVQSFTIVILYLGCLILWFLMSSGSNWPVLLGILVAAVLVWLSNRGLLDSAFESLNLSQSVARVTLSTYLAALTLGGFLNLFFYPALLRYQSGGYAADWIADHAEGQPIYMIGPHSYSLDFYSRQPVLYASRHELEQKASTSSVLLYTSQDQLDTLKMNGFSISYLHKLEHYPITRLKLGFLIPSKRSKYLEYRWIALVGIDHPSGGTRRVENRVFPSPRIHLKEASPLWWRVSDR